MGLIPSPAQYLLRCDDLCPTMEQDRWQRLLGLIEEFGIRPILAVIPDNRDPDMECCAPDPQFWAKMREMEAAGATIAAHGCRHLCKSSAENLLGVKEDSEFAGLPFALQRRQVAAGLAFLREQGLNPRIWVAPRHAFDRNTLFAVRREGIHHISDGMARVPFTRCGITWIPQQLWSPVAKEKGLWTICIHSNSASNSGIEELRSFLSEYSAQFTSFDRVVAEFSSRPLGFSERIYETYATWRLRMYRRRPRHVRDH